MVGVPFELEPDRFPCPSCIMKTLLWFACGLPLSAGTLKFDEMANEIQVSADAKTVTADFSFKNEGPDEVIVERFKAECTCITPSIKDGKLVYKPGESGVISTVYDTARIPATMSKSISVWLKGDPDDKPSVILTTRVIVPVLVEVEPQSLIWEVGSNPEPKTVTLTMKHSGPIKVTSITRADPRFKHELKTIEEGKKYQITVTPGTTRKVGAGVIVVETDCKDLRYRSQRIFTVVRQPLQKPLNAAGEP